MNKWTRLWFDVARAYSNASKDPSSKIGAIVVGGDRQLSAGWNGLPRRIADTEERLNDREVKYSLTVHAEQNCIYNASHNGVSLAGAHMYVYGLPVCSECAKGVIQAGIRDVSLACRIPVSDKWRESFKLTKSMFTEAGVFFHIYEIYGDGDVKEMTAYDIAINEL